MVCNANLDHLVRMLTKLWNKTESYVVAYEHPGCHRTSNAVDRPMTGCAG